MADAARDVGAVERELAAARAAAGGPSGPGPRRAGVLRQPGPRRAPQARAGRRLRAARPANWAVFDPALPRSAPQILVIGHFSGCLDGPKPIHAGGCAANRRLLESIDRQALLAWLR
jgi:hypothetical protein